MGTFLIFALILPFYSASNVSPFVTNSPPIRSTIGKEFDTKIPENLVKPDSNVSSTYLATDSLASPINSVMQLGVPLGLFLGSSIFTSIAMLWLSRGGFEPKTTAEWMLTVLCLSTWISNTVFEVWTLDGPRKILLGLRENNSRAWTKARAHIIIHALFCIALTASLLFNYAN